jgi:tetratricopeptide (TPR) repeat protein
MDKNNDIQISAIDDRIDAFVRGMMTEEEEAAFKQEIKADPELRNHVMASVSLIKGIREQNAKKERIIIQNNTKDRIRTLTWWATSIAAVFAILIGYTTDKRHQELSNIVTPYYTQYNINELSRGETDSAIVYNLYTLFNEKDAYKIIKELEPIYPTLDSNETYYLYANDIAWNLALAYVKNDQINKAIPILEKLEKDNPDTPIAIKAHDLLIKIRKL